MNDKRALDIGLLISRVALGAVLLAHSAYLKLVVFSLPETAGFFASLGLPGATAYLTFAVEVVAGLALIVGLRTRIAAAAAVPVLLGATWAHWSAGWLFTNTGGGWEYPLFLAVIAVAQTFAGGGSLTVSRDVWPAGPRAAGAEV